MTLDTNLPKQTVRERKVRKGKGGAPKGNKNALGNEGGRPIEHDYSKLAKDIVEWAKKPDSFNLIGFASSIGVLREQLYDFAAASVEFSHALIQTRQLIIINRERMVSSGQLHQSVYNRYASLHDKELLKHERAEKAYEIELKAKNENMVSPDQTVLLDALLKQIKTLQDQVSARKIEDSSNSNEQKS